MKQTDNLLQKHICPVCKKESTWYSVGPINQDAPCSIECQKKIWQRQNKKGSGK